MKATVFLVLLAIAAATSNLITKRQIYKYQVTGKSFVSIFSVKDEWAGAFYNASLEFEPTSKETWARLTNLHYLEQQGPLNEDWTPDSSSAWKSLPLTNEPFEIIYEFGKITKIQVAESTPQWEVNFIRSVANLFQVTPAGPRVLPSRFTALQQGEEPNAVFKVQEVAVDGICETLYEIAPMPEDQQFNVPEDMKISPNNWIQYTKTTNFSNCEKLPVYNVGVPQTNSRMAGNRMGEFFSRSNHARLIKAGYNGPILSSEATSTVVISPELYNQQKGQAVTKMNMLLTDVKIEFQIDIILKARTMLKKWFTYSLTNDLTGKPFINIQEETSSSSSDSSSSPESLSTEVWMQWRSIKDAPWNPTNLYPAQYTYQNITRILKELNTQTVGSKEDLENFMILTTLVRTLSFKQMKEIANKYHQESSNEWANLRDAIVQGGTGPTILTIKDFIEKKKVTGEEAAAMLGAQAKAVKEPSIDLIKTFFEIVKSKSVEESFSLKTAATSSFTNLIRTSIVDHRTARALYPLKTHGPLALQHIKSVEDVYIPFMAEKLKQAVENQKSNEIQLYIHALGNIAYPSILEVFEPYLEGKTPKISTMQRTLMVVSLNKMGRLYPSLSASVMFKVFSNVLEPYQVRVAALYNLMNTNPPVDVVQRVAAMSKKEMNRQVRAAIKTSIESTARLTGEWNMERRKNAKAAIHLLPADPPGLQYSRQHLVNNVLSQLSMSVEQDISYIGSDDSLIPQAVFARVSEYYNEILSTGFMFNGMVSSVSDLAQFLQDNDGESEEPITSERLQNVLDMLKSLNINNKPRDELEGNLHMSFAGWEKFFLFNNKSLNELSNNIKLALKSLQEKSELNYQRRAIQHETVLAYPTILGFPVTYSFVQPSVINIAGSMHVITTDTFSMRPDLEFTFASRSQGHIRLASYSSLYVAGNDRSLKLHIPLAGRIDVNMKENSALIRIDAPKKDETELFSYSQAPFTAIGDSSEPKLLNKLTKYKPLHVREPRKMEKTLQLHGATVRLYVQTEKKLNDHGFMPVLGLAFPMAEKSIEPTNYKMVLETGKFKNLVWNARYETLMQSQAKAQINKLSSYKSNQIEDPEKSGHEISHSITSSLDVISNDSLLRYEVFVGVTPSSSTVLAAGTMPGMYFVLNAKAEMPSEQMYNFRKSLNPQRNGYLSIRLTHGDLSRNSEVKTCRASVVMKRTEPRLSHVQKLPQSLQCFSEMQKGNFFHYGCRNATFHAGLYDRYEINVDFKGLSEESKHQLSRVLDAARYMGYRHISEDTTKKITEKHQLLATVQYHPDLKNVDVTINTEAGQFDIHGIPVHKVARSVAVVHPVHSLVERVGFASFRQQWTPTCSIDDSMMSTFDNCTHRFLPKENDWTVMAVSDPTKFTTKNDNFVVLHKENAVGRREVLVHYGGPKYMHTASVIPLHFGIEIFVDDIPVPLAVGEKKEIFENDKMVLTVSNLGDMNILISTPLIEVMHMPMRSVIVLKKQIRVSGLCGDANHEPRDMISPQGKYLLNHDEFVASWVFKPQVSSEEQRKANRHGISRPQPYHNNIISEQDAGRANKKGQSSSKHRYFDSSSPESRSSSSLSRSVEHIPAVTKKLKIHDAGKKICFSTEVQNACKLGSMPLATVMKEVEFVCLEKDSTSLHWAKVIRAGAKPDVASRGKPELINVSIPTKCSV